MNIIRFMKENSVYSAFIFVDFYIFVQYAQFSPLILVSFLNYRGLILQELLRYNVLDERTVR